jgi:hypothetical protein
VNASQSNTLANIDAEAVLAAALKILGIYLLYSAILRSSVLLNAMFTIAMATTNSGSLGPMEWGRVASSMMSTVVAAGLAIVLIRHGGRAAHWFSMRPDLKLSVGNPTHQWYAGSLIFIGIWILVMQFPSSLHMLTLTLFQTQYSGQPNPTLQFTIALFHSGTALALGLGLIFAAPRLGNWLFRMSGAGDDTLTSAETQ